MPRYRVIGAHRESGNAIDTNIDVPNKAAAERWAREHSVLVSRIDATPGNTAPRPVQTPAAPVNPYVPPRIPPPPTDPGEVQLYRDGDTLVTDKRVVIFGKTYAVANITSVQEVFIPPRLAAPLIGAGIGLILIVTGGNEISGAINGIAGGVLLLIVGILCAGLCIRVALKANGSPAMRMNSASGEADALVGAEKAQIARVVDAINRAIIDSGRQTRGDVSPAHAAVTSSIPPAFSGPGRYKIVGVARETGNDITTYVQADTEANAKVKAELKGIVVTEVARA